MRADSASAIGVLVAGMPLLAFGTPLRLFWTHTTAPWWLIYTPCICAVIALFVVEKSRRPPREEHDEQDR